MNLVSIFQYFETYKLGPPSGNYTESEDIAKPYRMYFLSYLGFTAQVPNVILNGMNLFCQCGGYVENIFGLGGGSKG